MFDSVFGTAVRPPAAALDFMFRDWTNLQCMFGVWCTCDAVVVLSYVPNHSTGVCTCTHRDEYKVLSCPLSFVSATMLDEGIRNDIHSALVITEKGFSTSRSRPTVCASFRCSAGLACVPETAVPSEILLPQLTQQTVRSPSPSLHVAVSCVARRSPSISASTMSACSSEAKASISTSKTMSSMVQRSVVVNGGACE